MYTKAKDEYYNIQGDHKKSGCKTTKFIEWKILKNWILTKRWKKGEGSGHRVGGINR